MLETEIHSTKHVSFNILLIIPTLMTQNKFTIKIKLTLEDEVFKYTSAYTKFKIFFFENSTINLKIIISHTLTRDNQLAVWSFSLISVSI